MNLEVAAGWLGYCGLPKVHPHCIDPDDSARLHMASAGWAMGAVGRTSQGDCLKVDRGECRSGRGVFLGRFLAVRLDSFFGDGLYAVAATANTNGGEVRSGAVVLWTERQVRGLCEDMGRAMMLTLGLRRGAILAAMTKWEDLNPPRWVNPFRKERGPISNMLSKAADWWRGAWSWRA